MLLIGSFCVTELSMHIIKIARLSNPLMGLLYPLLATCHALSEKPTSLFMLG